MEKPTKLLIDGDGILYRCGFAVEKTQYLTVDTITGDTKKYDRLRDIGNIDEVQFEIWSRKRTEPLENALFLTKTVMAKILEKYPGCPYSVWLTPPVGNFRDKIAKSFKYKGNRDFTNRPKYFTDIKEFLMREFKAKVSEGQEADDELGIGATEDPNALIVSYDKDLRQVSGRHYNWVADEEFNVNKREGTLTFYGQVLSGDPTDNIFGLKGVGPATASKMLGDAANSRDCWKIVLSAYKDQFGENHEERALENARLCWIRRKPNELWEPPNEV